VPLDSVPGSGGQMGWDFMAGLATAIRAPFGKHWKTQWK
jgi:hypothetical protein